MKFRKKTEGMPNIIVIPMIDIMFFRLVFFMLGTMYMTNVKTVAVNLSKMTGSVTSQSVAFAVSVDDKGDIFIGDTKVDRKTLGQYAMTEVQKNPDCFIVLRTDKASPYEAFSRAIETLRTAGVSKFGIATDQGE